MDKICLYHANCNDGYCCAYLLNKYRGYNGFPVQYGGAIPWDLIDGNDVIVADFSWPAEVLNEMRGRAGRLLVIDHHKTCPDLDWIIKDTTKSGAMLVAEFIGGVGDTDMELAMYVQDRDLWQWKLPKSREINAYLSLLPKGTWGGFEKDHAAEMGFWVLTYQKKLVESVKARAATWEGYNVGVVNSCFLQSEIGERFAPEFDFVCIWFVKDDGLIICSLRSNGVDVAEVAKRFGGGGHKLAAGFECKVLPW